MTKCQRVRRATTRAVLRLAPTRLGPHRPGGRLVPVLRRARAAAVRPHGHGLRPGRFAGWLWGRLGCRGVARDAGSATVELAVSLPALVLLLFAGLTAISAVRTQLECVDAAREAARAAARGESGVVAGSRVAPEGASIGVSTGTDTVSSTVSVRFTPFGGGLPGFDIGATAVAALEPGGGGG